MTENQNPDAAAQQMQLALQEDFMARVHAGADPLDMSDAWMAVACQAVVQLKGKAALARLLYVLAMQFFREAQAEDAHAGEVPTQH